MEFIFVVAALIIVITIHEFSHAYMALKLGDPTAKLAGRVSLNPLRHLDPMGTIMIFVARIGWGKPVPVNPSFFKNAKRGEALTALAGPASNLVLAFIVAIPIKYFSTYFPDAVLLFLITLMEISIILFAFNMLPFPPLDGSKFVQLILPKKYERAYEYYLKNGSVYFILFLLADLFVFSKYTGFSILWVFISTISTFIKSIIFLGS
jgi:Zn-dependent protease